MASSVPVSARKTALPQSAATGGPFPDQRRVALRVAKSANWGLATHCDLGGFAMTTGPLGALILCVEVFLLSFAAIAVFWFADWWRRGIGPQHKILRGDGTQVVLAVGHARPS